LERYPINVRYYRDSRSSIDRLGRVLVPAWTGVCKFPLAEIATLKMAHGPAMLRNENGMLSGYVYVDVSGRDVGSYVADARRAWSAESPCRPAIPSPGAASMKPCSACASG